MTDDPIITIDDIRKVGICASGTRRWFEAQGLDFRDFMQNGISASVLAATGDAQALRVVEAKLAAVAPNETEVVIDG